MNKIKTLEASVSLRFLIFAEDPPPFLLSYTGNRYIYLEGWKYIHHMMCLNSDLEVIYSCGSMFSWYTLSYDIFVYYFIILCLNLQYFESQLITLGDVFSEACMGSGRTELLCQT